MTTQTATREQTIADYLAVVRRYKWLIIIAVLVVPSVAYVMSAREAKVFRATADVLLNRQDLGATITGLPTQSTVTDPFRYALTQERLAEADAVRDRAVEIAGLENVEGWGADVSADPDTDVLTFAVTHGDPDIATRLANAYAQAFTQYKLETDTASLTRARGEIQGRLAELREAGATGTDTYQELLGQAQDLRTLEILLAPATVISTADGAGQIAPAPRRNAILGVMLGLLLGVGAAFALNAFDRRIRHADEIEHELQIPLLAKLPTPGRGDATTILERPPDETTEAVARLRASFDFTNQSLERQDCDGHERRPARGQVDHDRQSGDCAGAHGPPCRARRPRPAPADAQPALPPSGRPGDHRLRVPRHGARRRAPAGRRDAPARSRRVDRILRGRSGPARGDHDRPHTR